ncbi:sporulation-delaying protein SdpB family protein [Umezawaea endophytica]|uniref:HTTM-like domain-containing protein n=1 Tax=Umezawaea endophytica TaxID=1654476 RepID=A0A9X3A3Q0_9PSEU|nr:sporulation-delaying protein SdpB family protein [Umezawaea endophytica]MCS7480358.1 hypothetical protein [Umezawaea endophytica]
MPDVNGVARRLSRAIDQFEPRGAPLAVGRSLLAAATLLTILFSSDSDLFIRTAELPDGLRCAGVRAASLWCLVGPTGSGLLTSRVVVVVVLVLVLLGVSPRWTCVPHWYVSFSLAAAMDMANGGDTIAQVATMLLVPVCLGDDRPSHWHPVRRPLAPSWRGSAFAAHLGLRVQVCLIYLGAVTAKLMDPLWQHGSAMSVVVNHPQYGFPTSARDLLAPMSTSYWFVAALSWSVIGVQVVMALAILGPRQVRVVALVLGIALHLGIMFFMSLMSFGMVMIAVLVIGSASTTPQRRADRQGVAIEEGRRS